MLPYVIAGGILAAGVAIWDKIQSDNLQDAIDDYNEARDDSIYKMNNHYKSAKIKDDLDKLYKLKRTKVKLSNEIYRSLKEQQKSLKMVQNTLRQSKEYMQKSYKHRDKSIIKATRKELFQTQDSLFDSIKSTQSKLKKTNQEVKDIKAMIEQTKKQECYEEHKETLMGQAMIELSGIL